jgi:hypothetical protein
MREMGTPSLSTPSPTSTSWPRFALRRSNVPPSAGNAGMAASKPRRRHTLAESQLALAALASVCASEEPRCELMPAWFGYTRARVPENVLVPRISVLIQSLWRRVFGSNCRVFHPESLMRPADPGQPRPAWLSSGRSDQLRSAETSSTGSKIDTRFASVLTTRHSSSPSIFARIEFLGPTGCKNGCKVQLLASQEKTKGPALRGLCSSGGRI